MTSIAPNTLAISQRHLLTATEEGAVDFEAAWDGWLERLVSARVDALQIREKDLEDGPLLALVRRTVRHLARHDRHRPKVLVNGRLDIALAGGADGVHLPAQGVPLSAVLRQVEHLRRPASRRFLVGCSTHDADEVRRVAQGGADYVVFGPLFPTPSKPDQGTLPGVDGLGQVGRIDIPVLALGGITQPHHVSRALRAGAHGVAAIRGFLEAPSRLVSALHAELAKSSEVSPAGSGGPR